MRCLVCFFIFVFFFLPKENTLFLSYTLAAMLSHRNFIIRLRGIYLTNKLNERFLTATNGLLWILVLIYVCIDFITLKRPSLGMSFFFCCLRTLRIKVFSDSSFSCYCCCEPTKNTCSIWLRLCVVKVFV